MHVLIAIVLLSSTGAFTAVAAAAARNCSVDNGQCGLHQQCVTNQCGSCDVTYVSGPGTSSTGDTAAGVLGNAATYGLIAATNVTNSGSGTLITGNLALTPGTSVLGAPTVTGTQNIANGAAFTAMGLATATYESLSALACTNVAAQLGGQTFGPGVYCINADALLTTGNAILAGAGQYVFRIAGSLTVSTQTVLQNGTQNCQVFWVVGTSVTFGAGSSLAGAVLATDAVRFNGVGAQVSGTVVSLSASVALRNTSINAQTACSAVASNATNCTAAPTCQDIQCLFPTTCVATVLGATCSACPAGYLGNGTTGCVQQDLCSARNVSCQDHAFCESFGNNTYCVCAPGFASFFDLCSPIVVCAGDGPPGTIAVAGGTVSIINNCADASVTVVTDATQTVVAPLDTGAVTAPMGEQLLLACITLPTLSTCLPFADTQPVSTWSVTASVSCTLDVSPLAPNARSNGGCDPYVACTDTVPGNRTCGACPPGFTGSGYQDCTQTDQCVNVTCPANAECVSFSDTSFCVCLDGHAGPNCTAIDPCAGNWTGGSPVDVVLFLDNGCMDGVLTTTEFPEQGAPIVGPGESDVVIVSSQDLPGVATFLFFDDQSQSLACNLSSVFPVNFWNVTTIKNVNGTCGALTCVPSLAPTFKNGGCDSLTECIFNGPGNRTCSACPPGYIGAEDACATEFAQCTAPCGSLQGDCDSCRADPDRYPGVCDDLCDEVTDCYDECNEQLQLCQVNSGGGIPGYYAGCKAVNACANATLCAHGNCTSSTTTPGGFRCICDSGYYAVLPRYQTCAPVTVCAPYNPCKHGGTCRVVTHRDNSTSAKCTCLKPWTGRHCSVLPGAQDVDVVLVAPDDNPLLPAPLPGPVPPPPWAPTRDACTPNPCFHGGACRVELAATANGNPFRCTCTQGWSGDRCTHRGPREPCTDHKCANSGLCLPDTQDAMAYTCACQAPWTGAFCDTKDATLVCSEFGHCHNGGHCEPISDVWHDDSDPEDGIMAFRRGWSAHCVCPDGVCGGSCQRTGRDCGTVP